VIEKSSGEMSLLVFKVKTLMGRGDIIKETTLEIFNTKDAKFGMKFQWSIDHMKLKAKLIYGSHLIVQ
jgi:molybdopterin-containing oxidoreductase family iron-sulfur binding subunit